MAYLDYNEYRSAINNILGSYHYNSNNIETYDKLVREDQNHLLMILGHLDQYDLDDIKNDPELLENYIRIVNEDIQEEKDRLASYEDPEIYVPYEELYGENYAE